jgi:hypothetical protein
MSDNDYIEYVKIRNAKLFENPKSKILITPENFIAAIKDAFNIGKEAGLAERPEPSLFEKLFGKNEMSGKS